MLLRAPLAAQDLTAIGGSTSAGVLGLDINPASIADSKLRMDFLLLSAGFNIQGDYAALNRGQLFGDAFDRADFRKPFSESSKAWRENHPDNNGTRGPVSQYVNGRANLAPWGAFMLTLSPKAAIAFSANLRFAVSAVDAQPQTLRLFLSDFRAANDLNERIVESGSLQVQQWYEYGLSYARVLRDAGRHVVKAGARLKLLQGANGLSVTADNLDYTQVDATTTQFARGRLNYAYSDNFGLPSPLLTNGDRIFQFTSSPGLGFDLGVVYEFRPRIVEYSYDIDGERNLPVRDLDKYRLRVGLSVLDIGSIGYSANVAARSLTLSNDTLRYADLESASPGEVATRLERDLPGGSALDHRVGLPTRLSLQLDGRISNHWFVGAALMQNLADPRTATVMPSTYQVTPRYESRVFDVLVPVTFNELGHSTVGTFVRFGPLIIGSNSLWSSLVYADASDVTDVFLAVKIPVRYNRPKDRDGDKVSDDRDRCPKQKGTWEFDGCPDTDGDHVADKDDQCPQEPGLPRFGGCPDSDGDGTPDKDDQCPRIPGPLATKGCPEGIIELKKD